MKKNRQDKAQIPLETLLARISWVTLFMGTAPALPPVHLCSAKGGTGGGNYANGLWPVFPEWDTLYQEISLN